MSVTPRELLSWCRIPHAALEGHPARRVPFRMVADSAAMGGLMAAELVDAAEAASAAGRPFRLIVPCGPSCWYRPFTDLVNRRRVSLRHVVVFHMDECLDWQGRELPRAHPYSFRGFMERHFYAPVSADLAVPEECRRWPRPENVAELAAEIAEAPVDLVYGGWGQDGHVAYNQARRHPYSPVGLAELRASTVRVQENNWDTIVALAHRTFGGAWQLVPPMSVTLGLKECLSARRVRLFSDTGSWKQTALRVALFSAPTPEYPITLLQEHPDAILTATVDTARHPAEDHPEWDFGIP